jgi:hypothetical protein
VSGYAAVKGDEWADRLTPVVQGGTAMDRTGFLNFLRNNYRVSEAANDF